MLCHSPQIERNLYQIQLLDVSGHVIKTNFTESPFQDPEILPSNRVGRWSGESKLETYFELDYNQSYQLQLINHSWKRCYVTVELNDTIITKKLIFPRQTATLTSNYFRCHQNDLIKLIFSPEASTEQTLSYLMKGYQSRQSREKTLPPDFEIDAKAEKNQTVFFIRFWARNHKDQVIDRINFRGFYPFGN
jgi:hypothetical protein